MKDRLGVGEVSRLKLGIEASTPRASPKEMLPGAGRVSLGAWSPLIPAGVSPRPLLERDPHRAVAGPGTRMVIK